jgi:hypothetical protein
MYVENSLELADPYWVDHNRKVLLLQAESTVSNEDEIIGNTDTDAVLHAVEI